METEWMDFEGFKVEDLGVEDEERLARALADVGQLALESEEAYLSTCEGGGVSVVLVAGHSLRQVVGGVIVYALEMLDYHLRKGVFERFLTMIMLLLTRLDVEEEPQTGSSDPMDRVQTG